MVTERNLLFAVLAFESEFLDLTQLTSACRAWAENKSRPLADLLVARGWLTVKNREFIDELLERKLAKHQHDPRVTLNSVVRGDVCDAIKKVADSDIQQSLSSWPSGGPVLVETLIQSEEDKPKSRYTWISEVGHGGLGKVWLARDNDLAREVALKEIRPDKSAASQEAVRRLIKEAQITGQLQHPNIVPVYEVNRGGRPFYTMKLVKGETLSKAIRRHHEQSRAGHEDPLSLPRLLNVFVNVCEALAYAHSRGIIHRDLKPENIVLGDYGEAIVLDWGLAKQIGSADEETAPVLLTEDAQSQATRQGTTPGTPAYMSPEQAAGRVDLLDERTDVYGLGTILFEILTGHAPHRTARPPISDPLAQTVIAEAPARLSVHDLLQRISEGPTPRARDVDATISRELDAICATAMSKKRDERYLDAKALAADVKRSLAHQPVSVYRTGAWERLRLWRRRNPVVASLSLFLAVSLLAGTIVSSFFALQSASRNRDLLKQTKLANDKTLEAQLKAEEARLEKGRADDNATKANYRANEARANSYVANIRLAASEWDAGHIANMNAALEAARPKPNEPDIRGWEWNCLWNLSHSELLTLKGYTGAWFSSDGKKIATVGNDSVMVWDAERGIESFRLQGYRHPLVGSFTPFSPDGKRILGYNDDLMSIKVWNIDSGQETLTLTGHSALVICATFSPDGKWVITGSQDNTAKVWDAESGRESLTLKGHLTQVNSAVFSPDCTRIVSSSRYGKTKIWDAMTGRQTLDIERNSTCLAFSPDGKRIVSSSDDGAGTVWNSETGEELLKFEGHLHIIQSLAFSPDGKRIVSSSYDNTVRIWDAENGQIVRTFKGNADRVNHASFSPDGRRIAIVSVDDKQVAGGGGEAKIYDAHDGDDPLKFGDWYGKVSFSPDGQRILSIGETTKLWESSSGHETQSLIGSTINAHTVSFSPDGKRFVTSDADRVLKVWSAENGGEAVVLEGASSGVNCASYSPNGKWIVGGGYPTAPRVWDAESGRIKLTLTSVSDEFDSNSVSSVAFSADGTRIVTSGNQLALWDAESGKLLLILRGLRNTAYGVSFSPNGKYIATGCDDGTVQVWSTESASNALTLKEIIDGDTLVVTGESVQLMSTLRGHTGPVRHVSFSPDGRRLFSGSWDRTLKVWDTSNGQHMLTLKGYAGDMNGFSISPDGNRIACLSRDSAMARESKQVITVWDGRPESESRDRAIEREARSALQFHRAKVSRREQLTAAVGNDPALSAPVRQKALTWATTLPLNFNDHPTTIGR